MLRKTLEAKATTTDLGEFTAIAAAYSVDRMNERIIPGAFASTIGDWQASGKQIPLHWDHSGSPADIIGTIDPISMRETSDGLEVSGQLDLKASEVAREAWRLMRNNAASLSFGYMVTEEAEADDGVNELKGIDLFEITITPAPANADTRVLSMKSVTEAEEELEAIKAAKAPDAIRQHIDAMRSTLDAMEKSLTPADAGKSVTGEDVEDEKDEEPEEAKSRPQDPLKNEIDRELLDISLGH